MFKFKDWAGGGSGGGGRSRSQQSAQDSSPAGEASDGSQASSLSRDQLLQRLHTLSEKNERFELRFRDVVAAYKSLLKEKQALELTVSALTGSGEAETPQPAPAQATASSGTTASPSGDEADGEATQDKPTGADSTPEDAGKSAEESEAGDIAATSASEEQPPDAGASASALTSLKQAIQTLTQEKATIMERFQQDKRISAENHRRELEQLHTKFENALAQEQEKTQELNDKCSRLEKQVESLTQQLSIAHQSNDEKDAKIKDLREAHAAEVARLREELVPVDTDVQKRLLDLNDKLQTARDAEIEAITKLNDEAARNRERELALEQELSRLKARAASAEYRGESKAMLKLKAELVAQQKEVERWKEAAEAAQQGKDQALLAAQQQIQEAQQRAEFTVQQQQHSMQLDSREKDLQEKRIVELSNMISRYEHSRLEDQKKIDALRDETSDYKDQVFALRERVKELQDALDEDDKIVIAKLQDTISRLKSRLHHALSANHADGAEEEPEGDGVVRQPSWLREDTDDEDAMTQADSDITADLQANLDAARQEAMAYYKKAKVREQLESEISRLKSEHRKAVEELHVKQQRTRQRQMALLADKDAEISRLRGSSSGVATLTVQSPSSSSTPPSPSKTTGDAQRPAPRDVLRTGDPLLHINNLEADHMNQREVARQRERELTGKCIQLEEANASLQTKLNLLQEEVRRFERNSRREGANLEYLKNIVYKYMITDMGRDRMAKAIAAVLQFSPEEERRVMAACSSTQQSSWLW
ncbi:hypothetical protein PTSG_07289 [Salpingoeca rosetta]|uniref:GRIP domain-containing protein n=1 Tax=Salpingoeca rosetta (strain ATCC 50818 / BSB-021) TaxID=946362 RepID=F2UJ00_SALR5|nr:uncharacterized protein PTSG_07289 [Salpingoeca rosetta]EGD76948.1 hypothetical protein PTSG_07289 [Salpingoeca rosetta]|eukprot:XP_004990788.1 hypothetical protein PTSG_07289 [Salpingoeca rosetta]